MTTARDVGGSATFQGLEDPAAKSSKVWKNRGQDLPRLGQFRSRFVQGSELFRGGRSGTANDSRPAARARRKPNPRRTDLSKRLPDRIAVLTDRPPPPGRLLSRVSCGIRRANGTRRPLCSVCELSRCGFVLRLALTDSWRPTAPPPRVVNLLPRSGQRICTPTPRPPRDNALGAGVRPRAGNGRCRPGHLVDVVATGAMQGSCPRSGRSGRNIFQALEETAERSSKTISVAVCPLLLSITPACWSARPPGLRLIPAPAFRRLIASRRWRGAPRRGASSRMGGAL